MIMKLTAFPQTEKALKALKERIVKYESDTFSASDIALRNQEELLDAIIAKFINDADCNCDGIFLADFIDFLKNQQST